MQIALRTKPYPGMQLAEELVWAADPDAPPEAFCVFCGGRVMRLNNQKRFGSGWLHNGDDAEACFMATFYRCGDMRG